MPEPVAQNLSDADKRERCKRLLVLYRQINEELEQLRKDGTILCDDLHKIIDRAKMAKVMKYISQQT